MILLVVAAGILDAETVAAGREHLLDSPAFVLQSALRGYGREQVPSLFTICRWPFSYGYRGTTGDRYQRMASGRIYGPPNPDRFGVQVPPAVA